MLSAYLDLPAEALEQLLIGSGAVCVVPHVGLALALAEVQHAHAEAFARRDGVEVLVVLEEVERPRGGRLQQLEVIARILKIEKCILTTRYKLDNTKSKHYQEGKRKKAEEHKEIASDADQREIAEVRQQQAGGDGVEALRAVGQRRVRPRHRHVHGQAVRGGYTSHAKKKAYVHHVCVFVLCSRE